MIETRIFREFVAIVFLCKVFFRSRFLKRFNKRYLTHVVTADFTFRICFAQDFKIVRSLPSSVRSQKAIRAFSNRFIKKFWWEKMWYVKSRFSPLSEYPAINCWVYSIVTYFWEYCKFNTVLAICQFNAKSLFDFLKLP